MSKKQSKKTGETKKNENSLNVLCIVSSVREGRIAERMVKFIENEFEEILKPKGHVLEVIGKASYFHVSDIKNSSRNNNNTVLLLIAQA